MKQRFTISNSIFISTLIFTIFIGNTIYAQTVKYQIGGELYDYSLNRIPSIAPSLFEMQDYNGFDVEYFDCDNPTGYPDLSFNLCLGPNQSLAMPLKLRLGQDHEYAGTSVKDIILIQSYLLGRRNLSRLAEFAADINCSGSVSTSDISYLRKTLLGRNITPRCGMRSMLPLDSVFDFRPDTLDWIKINNVPDYKTRFVPMLKGDVNGSLFSPLSDAELSLDAETHDSVTMFMPDIELIQGKNYTIALMTEEANILGVQMGFQYDTTMISMSGITSALDEFHPSNYRINNGELRLVQSGTLLSGQIIDGHWMDFEFVALRDGKLKDVFVNEIRKLPHRLVMEDMSVRPIRIIYEKTTGSKEADRPYMNMHAVPNPSSQDVRIQFTNIDASTETDVRVFSPLGELIYQKIENVLPNSENTLLIPARVFHSGGVYMGLITSKTGSEVVEILRVR